MNRRVRQSAMVAGWLLAALALPLPAAAQGGEAGGASSSVRMTPWGVIAGGIGMCVNSGLSERFGQKVVSIGDIDSDGLQDFLVSRDRCDTAQIVPWRKYLQLPTDLLLYRGVRGRAPMWSEGERIGSPSVLAANVQYLAHGDWDADGWVDLAVSYDDYTDSSTVRLPDGTYLFRVVVLWGQPGGGFDFSDTTRLAAEGSDLWWYVRQGIGHDFNNDGIADLALAGGIIYIGPNHPSIPPLVVYEGGGHVRWGRDGETRDMTWSWFATTVQSFGWLQVIDQDCDGHLDIVGHGTSPTTSSSFISVLYGSGNRYPDTSEAEGVGLSGANGKVCVVTDLTGDGVPELCMNTGEETIKIYLGRPGQRLRQQYGSGSDPPAPDSGRPWARPWATIHLPAYYGQGFPNHNQMIYTPGDLDLDAIDDLCAMTYPYMLCYTTARGMDDVVDADIAALYNAAVVRLGDIDGSGIPTFALQGENAVLLLMGSRQIVPSGANVAYPWHAPDFRCEHASGVPLQEASPGLGYLAVGLHPNPAQDKASITWAPMSGGAVVTVVDPLGNIVLRDHLPGDRGEYNLDLRRVGRGAYLVVVRIGDVAGSATLVAP